MRVSSTQKQLMSDFVGNALAANPRISIRKMQELVQQNTGRSISDKYLSRVMEDMRVKAIAESDRATMHTRLAEVRERYRLLLEELNMVAFWRYEHQEMGIKRPTFKEKLAAIKAQAQLETALFRTELYAGFFEKAGQSGTIELEEKVVGISRTMRVKSDAPLLLN